MPAAGRARQGPHPDQRGGREQTPGPAQAELVRKAIARNPLALVVEATDPAGSEISPRPSARRRDRGTDRGPGRRQALVAGRVRQTPAASRRRSSRSCPSRSRPRRAFWLMAAVNNAKNAKLALDGGAVLVIDTASDPLVEDRRRALAAALREAGVRVTHEIRCTRATRRDREEAGGAPGGRPQGMHRPLRRTRRPHGVLQRNDEFWGRAAVTSSPATPTMTAGHHGPDG